MPTLDHGSSGDSSHRPLIVTLQVDDAAQARFDAERRAHFPVDRLKVGAHVTLFHALPGDDEHDIAVTLASTAAAVTPFLVEVHEPVSLGRGVAYPLRSSILQTISHDLQQQWWSRLTPQDRQSLRPHVTVQNKVSPDVARRTLATLRGSYLPFSCTALGLELWRYDGGPWTWRARYAFGGQDPAESGRARGERGVV